MMDKSINPLKVALHGMSERSYKNDDDVFAGALQRYCSGC